MVAACPDLRVLEQLVLGRLSGPDAERLDKHVSQCSNCAKLLGSLRSDDPLVEAMRGVSGPEDTPEDAADALIPKLKRLRPATGGSPTTDIPIGPDTAIAGAPSGFAFLAPPQDPDELGRLGAYRVLKLLGAGGMGMVFLAHDPRLRRQIALKVVRPELMTRADARERFLREARAVAAIEHENIVVIHQADEDRGVPFLAMPLLRGESLEDRLRRADGPLPVDETLQIGRQIATGLAAAHVRGLVHRDIKPANIFLVAGADVVASDQWPVASAEVVAGDQWPVASASTSSVIAISNSPLATSHWPLATARVKILDFGLARAVESDELGVSQPGMIVGTPLYMSPEQGRGLPLDARADLFSLGCVLYRMTTGKTPFQGTDKIGILMSVALDQPAPLRELNPDVPPALAELIDKLLAKAPEERPASAQAVAEAIQAIEQERAEAGRPKPSRRRWLLASAAAVLCAAGLTAWFVKPTPRPVQSGEATFTLDEPDRRVVIQRGDEPEQTIDLKDGGKFSLPPGAYTVRAVHAQDGRRLLPERFSVKPGEVVSVDLRLVGEIRKRYPGSVWSVALSPGQDTLLALWACNDHSIGVWNAAGDHDPQFLEGHESAVRSVAFSADGRLAVSGSGDRGRRADLSIRIWDLENLKEIDRLAGHESWVTAVAFAPDGKYILSGDGDGAAMIWNIKARKQIFALEGHDRRGIHGVAFSPDGHRALTCGGDKRVILWDADSGRRLLELEGHTDAVRGVAFAPSGNEAASAGDDGSIRLWDLKTGKAREIRGDKGALNSVAYSPDAKRLLTGGADGSVRLWDAATGQELHCFEGHRAAVHGVAFSANGRRALSGGTDRTVRLWELPK